MTDRLTFSRRAAIGSAMALGLAACSPPKDSPGAKGDSGGSDKDTVNVFMYQKPAGIFCPIAPGSGPDGQVMSLIFESLMTANPQGELVPILAEKAPEISADATSFTFTLRKGLKWSDGTPLTSKDFVYSYTRAADETANPGAGMYAALKGAKEYNSGSAKEISGLKAPDDTTFVMEFTGPNAGLLGQVAVMWVMPEHATKDLPRKTFATDSYWSAPKVSCGPFKFSEFKTDQYVKVEQNPEYRNKAQVKNVFLKMVTADVATSQLGTGEMDIAPISPSDAESVEQLGTVDVSDVPSTGFVRAAWNLTQSRFKDVRVRQAFLCGVDRAGIVKSALDGKGKVRNSVFDPKQTPADIDKYEFDPKRAKKLLDDAGWNPSEVVKLAWVAGGNPDRDAAATAIQAQMKDIGLKVQLEQVQATYFTDAYKDRTYDMTLYGGGDYLSEPFNVYNIVASDRWNPEGGNNGYYSNKQVDAKLLDANASPDKATRQKDYEEASKIENGDPSQMWLYSPNTIWAVNKKLKGFQGLSVDRGFFGSEKWTFSG